MSLSRSVSLSSASPAGCGRQTIFRDLATLGRIPTGEREITGISPLQGRFSNAWQTQLGSLYPPRNIEESIHIYSSSSHITPEGRKN